MNNSWKETVLEIKEGTEKVQVSLSYGQLTASNIEAINAHLVAPFKRYLELLNIQGMPLPKVKQSLKGCISVYDTYTAYGQNYSAGGRTFYKGKTKPYYWEAYVYQSTQGPPGFETDQWRVHNLEHEFSHGLMWFLLGDYHGQLNAIFTEGMAEYLAHGSQCHHLSGVARKQHEKQLDLLSIIQPIQGEEVYSIGFLVMAYMIEETPKQWVKLVKAFQGRQDQKVNTIFSSFAKAQQSDFKRWLTQKAGIFESQKSCPIVLPQNNLSNTAHPNLTTFCEVNTLDTHHRYETELKQKAHVAELLKHLNQEEVSPEKIKTMITNRANRHPGLISKMYENVFAPEVLTLVKHKKLSTLTEVLDLKDKDRERLLTEVALEISKSYRVLENEEGKAAHPFEKAKEEDQKAIDEAIYLRGPKKEGEMVSRLEGLNQNKNVQAILSLLKVDLKSVQDILDKRSKRPEIVSRMCDNLYSPEVLQLVKCKKLNTLYGVLNLTEQSCIELTAKISQKTENLAEKPPFHRNEVKNFSDKTPVVQKTMNFASLSKNKKVNQLMNPKTGQMTSQERHERIMQWREEVNKQNPFPQKSRLLKEWSEDLEDADVVIGPSRGKMGAFAHPLQEEYQTTGSAENESLLLAAEHLNGNNSAWTITKLDDVSSQLISSLQEVKEDNMSSKNNDIWIEEVGEKETIRGSSVRGPHWVLTGIEEAKAEDVLSERQNNAHINDALKGKNVQRVNISKANPINSLQQGNASLGAPEVHSDDLWTADEDGPSRPSSRLPRRVRGPGTLNSSPLMSRTKNNPISDHHAQVEQQKPSRGERISGRVPSQEENSRNTGNKDSSVNSINSPQQGNASLGAPEGNNDLWIEEGDKGPSRHSLHSPRRIGRRGQPLNPSPLMSRTKNNPISDHHAQVEQQKPSRKDSVFEVSQFDQRSTHHQVETAPPLQKEFKNTVFYGQSKEKAPVVNEMPTFTMRENTSSFFKQGQQKKTMSYDGQNNIHNERIQAVRSRSPQNAIESIEDNQSSQEEQFKALLENDTSIQKALKKSKVTTWKQFREKIEAKNNSDQPLTSKIQEAFENLQFSTLNDFVSNRWLSCSALLTMTSVQREKFIEFPERISEIQESNEHAQGVLSKYQGTLNTTEGLLEYWYKPNQSRSLSIEDCYAPLEALIDVLNSESRCLKILKNKKKGGLSDEMHEMMGKKSQGVKNAKAQMTNSQKKPLSFFDAVALAGTSDRTNRFERRRR